MRLKLNNICKSYNNREVIKNINIEINQGIYALLGHNGAGKSTIIRILLGLLAPNKGEVLYDDKKCKGKSFLSYSLGYIPQKGGLDENRTVRDFLMYIGYYKDVSKKDIEENIKFFSELFDFEEYLSVKIKNLSGGTKQKVKITQAFINNPELVVLDEPSVGLDIAERKKLKEFLSEYGKKNTVIISTHIISDIDIIANNIIILKKGEVVVDGKLNELIETIPGKVYKFSGDEKMIEDFVEDNKKDIFVMNRSYDDEKTSVLRFMSNKNFGNSNVVTTTLEDLYTYHQMGVK